MIFNLYDRVAVKLGDESHVFDRGRLMFTEVQEIEKVTGLSYAEWQYELGRYSITAIAGLLHILRKRDGQPSDWGSFQFNTSDLDVRPLKDSGEEMTNEEMTADLLSRKAKTEENGQGPTVAAAGVVAPENVPGLKDTNGMSLSSPRSSTSGPGNSSGSRGRSSSAAGRTSTRS